MPPSSDASETNAFAELGDALKGFFDAEWYSTRYTDVGASGADALSHFVHFGAAEGRDPNRFFDTAWYATHYPDVAASGQHPLLHYLQIGAAELRNPHPRFDATFYVDQHPEAAANPLLYHVAFGVARGWLTEKPIGIKDYLPSDAPPLVAPRNLRVDIVIPVYRGLAQTQRCIHSVLADPDRPPGRVVVVDDRSPDPKLTAWLAPLGSNKRIELVRVARNQGFVASANLGMKLAGRHDVVLLNSDTEVPPGWLRRLAAHAYSAPRIASVSPLSNNATICSYPTDSGGPLAFDLMPAELDAACRAVNRGRSVEVPTTVGFCMYIRRAALDEVGAFDAETFGRGYGEENDFCMRASAHGWRHLLACDTFVYHEGKVSFGDAATDLEREAIAVLAKRYPHYRRLIEQHSKLGVGGPFRFAITLELFRRSGLPTILMLTHDLGGGVHRHIRDLVRGLEGRANCLLLEATPRGAAVSVPMLPSHPELALPAARQADLVLVLQSAGITRAHIHHLLGMDIDVRDLLHQLDVQFDVTVHDYFAICPQVNLLPWFQGTYCGEPDPAACNACIADRPNHGARDIMSWRRGYAWQFIEADRVICPSEDVRARIARYGLADNAIVVPHQPAVGGLWTLAPLTKKAKLRVAVLGVLANQKGALSVISLAELAEPTALSLHLIGYPEQALPEHIAQRITITGEYQDADLPALLAEIKPHVVWFPAQWPETYSYTLSAAIDAGLPVVASRIGAFTERLDGRPLSWLVDPRASAEDMLAVFATVRAELQRQRKPPATQPRKSVTNFYADSYLRPAAKLTTAGLVNLRRDDRLSIVVIPERFDTGVLTPCSYVRLLQPLDHPAIGGDWNIILADAESALSYRADIVVTQRYAVRTMAAADTLIRHCREHAITLLYDLDDDLPHIPLDHPDGKLLRPRARVVSRLLRGADEAWVSTPALATAVADLRKDVRVVANGLDERLWTAFPPPTPPRQGPLRIFFMGTMTHDADFAIVEPALARIKAVFGDHVVIDMLGVSARHDMPPWVNRVGLPVNAAASYAGFANWITQHHWDIGIAPLDDTPFNRCKSSIKTLDYAAIGMAALASDMEVYRGSLADGPGGWLVPNESGAWFVAMTRLLRDKALRLRLADSARAAVARWTLVAQATDRRAAWLSLPGRRPRRASATALREPAQAD